MILILAFWGGIFWFQALLFCAVFALASDDFGRYF